MLYTSSNNKAVLDTIDDKVSDIANCILALLEQGYIPNKNKGIKLSLLFTMYNAFENIDIFDEEQRTNIVNLYEKIKIL